VIVHHGEQEDQGESEGSSRSQLENGGASAILGAICAQCMVTATAAATAATRGRAWLASRISGRALERVSAGLIAAAVAAAALLI